MRSLGRTCKACTREKAGTPAGGSFFDAGLKLLLLNRETVRSHDSTPVTVGRPLFPNSRDSSRWQKTLADCFGGDGEVRCGCFRAGESGRSGREKTKVRIALRMLWPSMVCEGEGL